MVLCFDLSSCGRPYSKLTHAGGSIDRGDRALQTGRTHICLCKLMYLNAGNTLL